MTDNSIMRQLFTSLILLFIYLTTAAQNVEKTPFELSDGKSCETYEEVLEYCRMLDDTFEEINYFSYGKSSRHYELPMLILDQDGLTDAQAIHKTGRAVLMVEASIHPGEPDGTSAGLMLVRDILQDKSKRKLLQHVSVVFLPIVNADGYVRRSPYNRINQNGPTEMGWRTNAQNINMNRDFLRAETPAMKAWHSIFNTYLPDFFIDCHTTDGADYQYAITYDLPIYGNMEKQQTEWMKSEYLEPLKQDMANKGFPMFRYVSFRNWHDPESGIEAWVASPMLSEGYSAIKNRGGLLLETHMLKPYKIRVESTYEAILSSMEIIAQHAETLKTLNYNADQYCATEKFRTSPYPIQFAASDSSRKVEFLGIEYVKETSDLTGGTWYRYTGNKKSMMIDFYDDIQFVKTIKIPKFYVIPPEWESVIERLDIHGVKYSRLEKAEVMDVTMFRIKDYEFSHQPYEGAFRLQNFNLDTIIVKQEFPAQSVIVNANQVNVKVAAHLLDPTAPSSLLKWGYFNAIFEQKEYAENYVMEVVAPQLMKEKPELKTEFEAFLKNNPELKESQWAMLNWFYQKTEYWDEQKDLYPIGFAR